MRRFVLFIAILAVGLTGWMEYRRHRSLPTRAPLRYSLAPEDQWRGLTPLQRRGFGLMFKDCLEYGTGLVVVEEEAALPGPGSPRDALEVGVEQDGTGVRIRLAVSRSGKPERAGEVGANTPAQAVRAALAWLGLPDRAVGVLVPRSPALFWDLAGMAAWRPEGSVQGALAACDRILEREPACAGAWLTRGRLLNNHILDDNLAEAGLQGRCEQDFIKALALAPDYPRAATLFGRFRTETGNQRAALDLLLPILERNPRASRVYESVAYAARSAGLLEGAALALARRDALTGLSRGEEDFAENTYLYQGNLDRFEQVLGAAPQQEADALRDFYRGYARLARGDREGARRFFHRARTVPGGIPSFRALAGVYDLALDGRREEALEEVRRIWLERIPIRIPDGEFTFKLAEAFGFLDSPSEAQDVANRAFAQGFGCTRWYQRSPFLARVRGTPRWTALEEHLRDRQALMEAAYPRKRFEF